MNGQGRRQLVTVLLGSRWTGAWLVGKARPAGSRELKGAFQKEGTPAKSPAAAWPGPACLPRAEKGKRQGCAATGCFASRPRGWRGGWGPSALRTGPPEVRVIRCAPAAPPPCRQQLSEEELERLEEACDMALELNASKHRIYEYVESRMSFIAPNLSIIIGASTAAKIMGEAGPCTRDFGEACPFLGNRGVFYTSWGPARGHHPHPLVSGDRRPAWRPAELGPGSCRGGGAWPVGGPGTRGCLVMGQLSAPQGSPQDGGAGPGSVIGIECIRSSSGLSAAAERPPPPPPGTWSFQPRNTSGHMCDKAACQSPQAGLRRRDLSSG